MSNSVPPRFESPDDALRALAAQLSVVGIDPSRVDGVGRILARPVTADRHSPAADVSAMDGYAIRLSDLAGSEPVAVKGESAPGAPPPEMPAGAVVRIFTGAIVPAGAEAVVKREDTDELDGEIRFRPSAAATSAGEHIRRAGENAQAGSTVLQPGARITAAQRATMANFGCFQAPVYQPVKVCVITTGDEVGLFADDQPQPWQLRNSNRISLTSLLEPVPWIRVDHVDHCKDDRQALLQLISERIGQVDAVMLTGGVSMGNYDYVPEVVREIGGTVVFHGLPIRPGKPILGAATDDGKLLLGLPGNPVSATIGCRRMAMPLLAKQSGQQNWLPPCPVVRLVDGGNKTIPLHWMRLVRITEHGQAEAVISQGSGDLVSLGNSDGFVEVPPDTAGEGPWPYYAW